MRMFIEFEGKLYEKVGKVEKDWQCIGTCDFRNTKKDENYKDACQRFQGRFFTCSDLLNVCKYKEQNTHFGWKEVKA